MSRRRLPRRFPKAIGLSLAAVALTVSTAWAQIATNDACGRATVACSLIGARSTQRCAQFARAGDSSDAAVAACDLPLRSTQLPRLDRVDVLINRGAMHLHRREFDLALADFEAAVQLDPNDAEAHLNKGAALLQMHQPGPAVATITEALSLGVREPYKAYYNRGAAREALGDVRGAYEDYTTALQIHPNWAPAEAELARFVRGRQQALAGMIGSGPQTSGAADTVTAPVPHH